LETSFYYLGDANDLIFKQKASPDPLPIEKGKINLCENGSVAVFVTKDQMYQDISGMNR
jgi:hypothetical protein